MKRTSQAVCNKIVRNISRPYHVPTPPNEVLKNCELYEKENITLADLSNLIKKNPEIEGININIRNPVHVDKGACPPQYAYDAIVVYKQNPLKVYKMCENDDSKVVLKKVVKLIHTYKVSITDFY